MGDVAVIGIVESVVVVAVFGCVNLLARKRLLQLVVQLEEDPRPPGGRVSLIGGQLQEEVTLKWL